MLCEFRSRPVKGNVEQLILDVMPQVCVERKWLKARGKQRTDSIHVLALNPNAQRLKCAQETMRAAINALAVVDPEWLKGHSPAEWLDTYGPRAED